MLLVWNPQVNAMASRRSMDEAHLRDLLTSYLEMDGLVWLQRASPQELCARLANLSNSTITYSARVNSLPCNSQSPSLAPAGNLAVNLVSKAVVLEAWYAARG